VYLQVTTVHADERAALVEDFQQGEQQSKLVGYGKTLEVYPHDPWAREGLAGSYITLGRPQEAIRVLEERLKLSPAEIHSLAILGMAHFAGGDFTRAEELLRKSIAMDAEYPFSWLGLGKTLAAQQKLAEADEAFRRAVELAPGLTDAQLDRATLLLKQGKLNEAAAACEAAMKSAPDEPHALLKLAEIRTRQDRHDEALHLLEEAQRLAPYTHPPKVLLAVYCFQNGQSDRARKLLAEAHAEQPNHPVPLLFLGQLAHQEANLADARRYLDTAASRATPGNWPASHRKRFLILLHSERLKLAEQLDDEALARDACAQWLKYEPENEKLRRMVEQL
jgi:Flp pilus assembly protein TadD